MLQTIAYGADGVKIYFHGVIGSSASVQPQWPHMDQNAGGLC